MRLDDRVAGQTGNTAGVILIPGHLDVSVLSPGDTPAVLHQPVVLVLLGAVTDLNISNVTSPVFSRLELSNSPQEHRGPGGYWSTCGRGKLQTCRSGRSDGWRQ